MVYVVVVDAQREEGARHQVALQRLHTHTQVWQVVDPNGDSGSRERQVAVQTGTSDRPLIRTGTAASGYRRNRLLFRQGTVGPR